MTGTSEVTREIRSANRCHMRNTQREGYLLCHKSAVGGKERDDQVPGIRIVVDPGFHGSDEQQVIDPKALPRVRTRIRNVFRWFVRARLERLHQEGFLPRQMHNFKWKVRGIVEHVL